MLFKSPRSTQPYHMLTCRHRVRSDHCWRREESLACAQAQNHPVEKINVANDNSARRNPDVGREDWHAVSKHDKVALPAERLILDVNRRRSDLTARPKAAYTVQDSACEAMAG